MKQSIKNKINYICTIIGYTPFAVMDIIKEIPTGMWISIILLFLLVNGASCNFSIISIPNT